MSNKFGTMMNYVTYPMTLKEEIKAEDSESSGEVNSSTTNKIWTTLNSVGDVRILHMHLAGVTESVPITINHLPPSSKLEYYFKFEKEALGNEFKYKVLIQKGKVAAIIQNIDNERIESLPFNEIRVRPQNLMQASIPQKYDKPIVVKLLPTSALYWYDDYAF